MKNFSKRTQEMFDQFVSKANKTLLHPLDWSRFYSFIRQCHSEKINLKESDITERLIIAKFTPQLAGELYSVYSHGRAILKGMTKSG